MALRWVQTVVYIAVFRTKAGIFCPKYQGLITLCMLALPVLPILHLGSFKKNCMLERNIQTSLRFACSFKTYPFVFRLFKKKIPNN